MRKGTFALLAFAIATQSYSTTQVYTDKVAFLTALKSGPLAVTFEGTAPFNGFTNFGTSESFGPVNGYGLVCSAPGDLYSYSPGFSGLSSTVLSTNSEYVPITYTFTNSTKNVTAFGGDLFLTDFDFFPVAGTLTVTTNDGTTQVLVDPTVGNFLGFTSTVPIVSVTMDPGGPNGPFATADNIFVAERTVNPVTIQGTIDLQNWLADPSGQVVTFVLTPLDYGTPETKNVTLGAGGNYSFTTVLRDNVDITVQGSHWLRKLAPTVFVSESGANPTTISLINGDIVPDNAVDLGDFDELAAHFGTELGDAGYSVAADLDGNDVIDLGDFDILSMNFGTEGD